MTIARQAELPDIDQTLVMEQKHRPGDTRIFYSVYRVSSDGEVVGVPRENIRTSMQANAYFDDILLDHPGARKVDVRDGKLVTVSVDKEGRLVTTPKPEAPKPSGWGRF